MRTTRDLLPDALSPFEHDQTIQALSRFSTDDPDAEVRISRLSGLQERQRVESAIVAARERSRELEKQMEQERAAK